MKRIVIAVVAIAMLSGQLLAGDLTGLQVIESVYNRPTGDDIQGDLMMTLVNSRGDTRVREIKQFVKDFGDEEKKIMFFLSPADVRNTSFMNWSYDDESKSDDQWIYLPALKRVKRISSDSNSDYFMGSDFTYDDLGDRHPSEDTHKILRMEELEGKSVYVVESVSKDEDYMYSRTVTWVVAGTWVGHQKEYYDEDGDLLKILTVEEQEDHDGIIVLTRTKMTHIQKNQSTVMSFSNIALNKGIEDSKFTERIMRRGL